LRRILPGSADRQSAGLIATRLGSIQIPTPLTVYEYCKTDGFCSIDATPRAGSPRSIVSAISTCLKLRESAATHVVVFFFRLASKDNAVRRRHRPREVDRLKTAGRQRAARRRVEFACVRCRRKLQLSGLRDMVRCSAWPLQPTRIDAPIGICIQHCGGK
jgi:hypothetical protein